MNCERNILRMYIVHDIAFINRLVLNMEYF